MPTVPLLLANLNLITIVKQLIHNKHYNFKAEEEQAKPFYRILQPESLNADFMSHLSLVFPIVALRSEKTRRFELKNRTLSRLNSNLTFITSRFGHKNAVSNIELGF